MRVAAAQWRARPGNLESYLAHISEFINRAREERVELLVFPELPILEALASSSWNAESEVPFLLSRHSAACAAQLLALSQEHQIDIIGPTHFELIERSLFNVCMISNRNGRQLRYAKNRVTKWEREEWQLSSGLTLAPLIGGGNVGALLCYDSEFPEAARVLCSAGARVLAVPAYTESWHGFHRVRTSVAARAVENQVFALHASLVGGIGREPLVDAVGPAAVIAPPIEPFAPNGILAETRGLQDELAVAELDFEALEQARLAGDVRNWLDRNLHPWQIETEAPDSGV